MASTQEIYRFAKKWNAVFLDMQTKGSDVLAPSLADECQLLGFKMDCGHAFCAEYGHHAFYDSDILQDEIDEIDSINLLGSAVYSRWRYFHHWADRGEDILHPANRSWFITAFSHLAYLAHQQLSRFQGIPQKIEIISNSIAFDSKPAPSDEIEQHLAIDNRGSITFSAFAFGDGFCRHKQSRNEELSIAPSDAEQILVRFAGYFSEGYTDSVNKEQGDWHIRLTNTDGQVFQFSGSLKNYFIIDGEDISDVIRDAIPIDDLLLFDGNNKPAKIQKLSIVYHHIQSSNTQSITEEPELQHAYTEQLIVNNDDQSIEYTRDIDGKSSISCRYTLPSEIKRCRDGLQLSWQQPVIEQ